MKGGANAAWITWVAWALRSGGEARWLCKKSPRWSAGGCACRSHGAQHRKVPDEDHSAFPALRSLTPVREGKGRRTPRRPNHGDDESCLHGCAVWKL